MRSRTCLHSSRHHSLAGLLGLAFLLLQTGCITGDEADDAMGRNRGRELQEVRTLEEIGVISESTSRMKQREIEGHAAP